MRVKLFLAAVLFAGVSCSKVDVSGDAFSAAVMTSSSAVVETSPPAYSAIKTSINSNCDGFMQAVPSLYQQTTTKYPLIVFIHGIGELGRTLSKLSCCGLPYHLSTKTFPARFTIGGINYSFIVIAPQFKVRPTPAQVQSIIDFAKKRWRIDATRVYVTGLSMGGGSTWDWSVVYGQNAAAIVPVCAGTKPTTAMATSIASKNLPIWGLYSTRDELVPEEWGIDFFNWIDAKNPAYAAKTKLTLWTDADHVTTWSRAFNPGYRNGGYNIYEWMLLYKRN